MSDVLISAQASVLVTHGELLFLPSLLFSPSPGCGTSHDVVQVQETSRILEEVRRTLLAVAVAGGGGVERDRGEVKPIFWTCALEDSGFLVPQWTHRDLPGFHCPHSAGGESGSGSGLRGLAVLLKVRFI